jgi:hypothetical protein
LRGKLYYLFLIIYLNRKQSSPSETDVILSSADESEDDLSTEYDLIKFKSIKKRNFDF